VTSRVIVSFLVTVFAAMWGRIRLSAVLNEQWANQSFLLTTDSSDALKLDLQKHSNHVACDCLLILATVPFCRVARYKNGQPIGLHRRIIGDCQGVHWPDLDEDLSVARMFKTERDGSRGLRLNVRPLFALAQAQRTTNVARRR
jgi:hypothetical protein